MKRPMAVIGVSLALATWGAFFFSWRQCLYLSGAAAVTGLLLGALFRQGGRRWFRILGTACLAAAVAFALHARYEVKRIQPFYRAEGETVLVEGLVEEARIGYRAVRYTLAARFPGRGDLPPAAITLRSYGEMDYVAGDVIRCQVLLRPKPQPETGLRHGADRFLEGLIQGEGERLAGGYPVHRAVLTLRGWLRENAYRHLNPATAGVVTAMVLGMDEDVSPQVYSAVNRAGTIHLLSVSGLHLSVLTALILHLLERLGLSVRWRSLAAIGAAFGFAGLVGFSPSMTRAAVMTSITLAAGLGRRKSDSLSSLGFAAAVLCLVRPDWALSRGFWLSAGSTLGILLFASPIQAALFRRLEGDGRAYNRLVKAVVDGGAVSLAAYSATLPFLILFNGWIPLLSPFANLLVSPFLPVVMVGGVVCSVVGSGALPVRLVAALTDFCAAAVLKISEIVGSLPFATASLDEGWMVLWLALAMGIAVTLVAVRGDKRLAGYGVALAVVAFCAGDLSNAAASRGRVELATISDCQVAVLLRGKEAVLLGTPAYYEAGRLLRYLEFRGVERIQAVMAADCGEQVGSGLPRVGEEYPIGSVIGPNDAYILSQLAQVMPQTPVYSGGYAVLEVLGGVRVSATLPRGDLVVEAGENRIVKSTGKYDIIKDTISYTIGLYPEGAAHLAGASGWEPSPLGKMLYGETRYRMKVEGGG